MLVRNGFRNDILFATMRVEVVKSEHEVGLGTGFVMTVHMKNGRGVTLLVSNRHVFEDCRFPIALRFHHRTKEKPTEPALGITARIDPLDFSSAYFTHPDDSVDLACINISRFIVDLNEMIYYKTLYPEYLATYAETDLLAGEPVLFVGYPDGRFDEHNNLPIVRSGVLASYPHADFEGRPMVVVDAQVFGGSSGSPVFMKLSGQWRLVGVIAETMIRYQEVIEAVRQPVTFSQQLLGLGLALKSRTVKELLEHVVQVHEAHHQHA